MNMITILVDRKIPFQVNEDELESFTLPASEYISRLQEIRNIKATGSLPIFRKNYRNSLMRLFRYSYVYSSKILQRGIGAEKLRNIDVTDFFGAGKKVDCQAMEFVI